MGFITIEPTIARRPRPQGTLRGNPVLTGKERMY